MNDKTIALKFGPDKSQILRGIAIIFMIILHNGGGGLFKICVPIFTFLVGYGYAFAKRKDLMHGLKRSWHLLSHFWLILLGIFLPVAIWKGGYEPALGNVLANMFGLESNLNWYSWYIYFYLYAMIAMIPMSRILDRSGLWGTILSPIAFFGGVYAIHLIPDWSNNIWLQAIHDCILCSPVMFSGYYCAKWNIISKLKLKGRLISSVGLIFIAVSVFFFRMLPYASFADFLSVPVFCLAIVALFNIVKIGLIDKWLILFGKESMNMWFLHALFATSFTAAVFDPLLFWIQPKALMVVVMIILSYFAARLVTAVYEKLKVNEN